MTQAFAGHKREKERERYESTSRIEKRFRRLLSSSINMPQLIVREYMYRVLSEEVQKKFIYEASENGKK